MIIAGIIILVLVSCVAIVWSSTIDRGVLEKKDELRWLYPNMTEVAKQADERKEEERNNGR